MFKKQTRYVHLTLLILELLTILVAIVSSIDTTQFNLNVTNYYEIVNLRVLLETKYIDSTKVSADLKNEWTDNFMYNYCKSDLKVS